MIRAAELSDVAGLVEMGARFHARSPFAAIAFDAPSLRLSLETMIERDDATVIRGEAGMIGVGSSPCLFNHGVRMAQEAFWFTEGAEGLDLLKAAEAWAVGLGCGVFLMGCLENPRSALMARLYRRAGFTPVERFFLKELR